MTVLAFQNYISPDALPSTDEGGRMRTWFTDDPVTDVRTYHVDRAYRRGDGTPDHFRRHTTDPAQHIKNQAQALEVTGESSLTSSRFSECVRTYREEKGDGGFSDACYTRAVDALGRMFPDKPVFAAEYARYVARLEVSGLAVNTVNNHRIVVRTVCNYAYETGRCGPVAVRKWGIEKGNERSRVLSSAEELALMNTLAAVPMPGRDPVRSHILEAVQFAPRNPIRKQDLFNLPRKALKMESYAGKTVWVVKFQAPKTRRHIKITTLPNIDMEFVSYVQGLPVDCPWMFPMRTDGDKGIPGLRRGLWRKIKDADKHFNYVLDKAGIEDFHFHDPKHCAETYMLRQGYTYEALRKLGIQTSPKTQQIYDNRSALEIVAAVEQRAEGFREREVKVA